MASILVPFTADGVSVTNGDLIGNNSSPAPSISGFVDASFGGNINATGNITAGGSLDIDGEGSIGGNLVIVGNIDFSGGGTINQITSPYGYFTGNTDGSNALYAGVPGGTIVPLAVAQFTSDANSYTQINSQNKNHGTQSSIEYVITGDLGTDTTDYLDIGFASSSWDGTQDNSLGTAVGARDGYLYVQGGGGGGNLVIGTTTSGRSIKFNAGGPNSANTVATIDSTGISATGNVTAGHLHGEGGNISNVQVANVSGLGNIATVNLTGSSSNVLYGNGVFAPAAGTSANIANGNSNVNIATANGNVTIAAVGNTVMTVTGTGANITGTANITGNAVMANLSFSANSGQIAFNTAAYISGNASSLNRDGSILLSPYTGTGSNFAGVIIGGSGRLLSPGGSVHQIFNSNDVTFQVAIKNITGLAATSTTSGALQITGGGGFTTNVYVGGSLVRTGAVTQAAWTTGGVGLKLPTAVYTDNSTAAGTQASSYVHLIDAPTLSFSNAVTVTNAATMYVAAPSAGTNATISNAYAILANGNVQVNGNLNATGNITANNFSGNISITGNVTGTSPNVSLVAGSYTYTFDNAGTLTMPAAGGNEGAEIDFTKAPNSSLSGNTVVVDQYVDRLRFFEGGGTNRGVYIDFTQAAASVGTLLNNRVSGFVNAGTYVTMDLIKATVTSSGNRGLSLATTTGTFTYNIAGNYAISSGAGGISLAAQTLTTTATSSIFSWNLPTQGDLATYILSDITNNRTYRITLQVGGSFLNNSIIIERLI